MVASPIVPLGWGFSRGSVGAIRSCAEDVDGVVVSFRPAPNLVTEVVDKAAIGVRVGGSPVPRECRPAFDDPGRLAPSSLRTRSRFLGFPSDIFSSLRYQVRLVEWMDRPLS